MSLLSKPVLCLGPSFGFDLMSATADELQRLQRSSQCLIDETYLDLLERIEQLVLNQTCLRYAPPKPSVDKVVAWSAQETARDLRILT
jgi:hypothetical protein